ncbi:MAG: acyl-CoA dehydrogenase [Candidatus Magnetomorum sp.]|nr:acyl-CoA dehydrogenase [Candidatus Magnetomorum sp.]
MNFSFSDQEKQLFQEMESALTKEKNVLEPGVLQTEKDIQKTLQTLQKNLFPLGYLDGHQDKTGKGHVNTLEMMRIFSRCQPSLFLGVEYSCRIFNELIKGASDEHQRKKLLNSLHIDNLPDPQIIGTVASCEDFVETDTHTSTVLAQVVDQKILLTGRKDCVINAGIADWIAITGNLNDKGAVFFVPSKAEGLDIESRSNTRIFPELVMATIHLNNCEVDQAQMISPVPLDRLISRIQWYENMAYIACSLGMMDQCIQTTTSFAKTHRSENKPMFVHQAVGFSLAEMLTLKQTAELLAFRAAWALDTNDPEKQILNHCAKVFCTETAEKVASKSMDILGGQVFHSNHFSEQVLQNSKFAQLAGTSTHLARVSIGDAVMKYK